MVRIYKTIKAAGDKIALLGLFVAALLIAQFISASRTTIVLSELIKLDHTGLSVPMPAGPGWQSNKKWKYQENGFTLSSVFSAGSANPEILVLCRYLLSPAEASVNKRFEQKASMIAGQIVKTGQTQTEDKVTIHWACIEKPETPACVFFGTARLPNDRQLELQVQQLTGEKNLAEQLFKSIAKDLKFKDNQFLEAGSEIVAQIKNAGVSSLLHEGVEERPQNGMPLDKKTRQVLLLIKDSKGRPVGFTMDLLADYDQQEKFNIRAASLFYIRGQQEQVSSFQSNNSFDEFAWSSQTSTLATRSGTELHLDDVNGLTVKKLGPQPQEKIYQLGPAAIPDVFLEFVFSQLLASEYNEIIVDVIDADGRLSAALVSKVQAEQTSSAQEKPGYLLRMELLGKDMLEWLYLDEHMRVSKTLLGKPNSANNTWDPRKLQSTYILERTTAENILREFPERAEYLLQKNETLNQL